MYHHNITWPSRLSCNQIQTNGMIAVIWRVFCMIKKLHKYLLKLLKSSNCSRYFVNSSFSSFFELFVLISSQPTTYYWVSTVSQLTQLSVKFKTTNLMGYRTLAWWFSVSPWRICITFVWPRGSLKFTAPSAFCIHQIVPGFVVYWLSNWVKWAPQSASRAVRVKSCNLKEKREK